MLHFGDVGYEEGRLADPRGIAIDHQQRVYVTDAARDLIIVFNSDGAILFSFYGPFVVDGALYRPLGIAINQQGKIFISDNQNNRIMVFSIS
jgi:DNA-binding beta-propeller fold protein YncE